MASREEMQLALARQFGYDDYPSFQRGIAETLGKGVLRQLERKLEQYEPAGTQAPRATEPPAQL